MELNGVFALAFVWGPGVGGVDEGGFEDGSGDAAVGGEGGGFFAVGDAFGGDRGVVGGWVGGGGHVGDGGGVLGGFAHVVVVAVIGHYFILFSSII